MCYTPNVHIIKLNKILTVGSFFKGVAGASEMVICYIMYMLISCVFPDEICEKFPCKTAISKHGGSSLLIIALSKEKANRTHTPTIFTTNQPYLALKTKYGLRKAKRTTVLKQAFGT